VAYLPDEAARSGREVSLAARVLYDLYCSYRNPQSGVVQVADRVVIEEAGIARRTMFMARKELTEKGWIEQSPAGLRCLKGIFPAKGITQFEQSTPALAIFKEFYPDVLLSSEDQAKIEQKVTDLVQFRETLQYWKKNGFRSTNIDGFLDNYSRLVAKKMVGAQPRPALAVPKAAPPPATNARKSEADINQLMEYAADLEAELKQEGREPQDWEANLIAEARKYRKVA
jgi:hypothetical protein